MSSLSACLGLADPSCLDIVGVLLHSRLQLGRFWIPTWICRIPWVCRNEHMRASASLHGSIDLLDLNLKLSTMTHQKATLPPDTGAVVRPLLIPKDVIF